MIRSNYTNYVPIKEFGSCAANNLSESPLTYCLGERNMDQKFLHGSSSNFVAGQSSKNCQMYLSQYCAEGWDEFCEFAAANTGRSFPNNMQGLGLGDVACKGLNEGQVLIINTARRKYLQSMGSCEKQWTPFDPNVANSPMISYWTKSNNGTCSGTSNCSGNCMLGSSCVPTYAVPLQNIATLDYDPVMNKLLDQPYIGFDLLINMYNTMKSQGTLFQLQGTRLGNYYSTNNYFRSKGGLSQ
jgi:hypothetical protein